MSIIRRLRLLTLSVLSALVVPAYAIAATNVAVPIAAFFDNARMSDARISPDARHLAVLFNNSKSQGRDQLWVIDLTDRSMKVVAAFAEIDIGNVEWVNNRRLVFDLRDKVARHARWTSGQGCTPRISTVANSINW
jgi:hypothetical protein